MSALMIVLLSLVGTALFIAVAIIIDVLMRWYFAMNRHIELLSGVKTQLQELKDRQAPEEPAVWTSGNGSNGKKGSHGSNGKNDRNGNGKEEQALSYLSSAETKAALENSLAALQKLEKPPKIWPPIQDEYRSKRFWVPQDKN